MRIIRIIAGLFIIYGFIAFTGWGMTILDSIPSFSPVEWPLGTVSGVVRDSSGRYAASNTAYSRVQVYDQYKKFITGWSVDDGGGNFHLMMNKNDQVEVFCVRNDRHYVYNLDGTLVSQSDYSPNDYPNLEANTSTEYFPTPLYLLPFSSPVFGWLIGVIGAIVLALLYKFQKLREKPPKTIR
jgi:hypothetical protein